MNPVILTGPLTQGAVIPPFGPPSSVRQQNSVFRALRYGVNFEEYIGSRSAARTVGWALKAAKGTHLPCHRVVNRYGALTGARNFGDPDLMERLLRSEGVTFDDEGCVILSKHLWIPGSY